ncbi:hypothetical protein BKA62DRAFT_349640 [Auriculariales sp. MPI-PUGE-AT-0066]|nr:hypothetical protein BKA62DRAFT_349640 [Auriculariales sp. MPI-PUGE-AT-0066]
MMAHEMSHSTTNTTAAAQPVAFIPVGVDLYNVWNLRRDQAVVRCPNCGKASLSNVEYKTSKKGPLVPLMCLPFCMCCLPWVDRNQRDAHHSCSSCGTQLAIWHAGQGPLKILAHYKDESAQIGQQPAQPNEVGPATSEIAHIK